MLNLRLSSLVRALCATLVTIALAGGLLVATPRPAAAGGGSLWSSNGVLYDTCRYHSYRYSVDAWDAYGWSLDVELIGPDGEMEDFDFLYDGSDPMSGTSRFQFCGWERPGRYEIHAELTWYDDDYNEYTEYLPVASFRMRKPYSRTTLTASDRTPRFNEVVTFRAQTRDERPSGYFATSYPTIRLQVRSRSGWVNVKGSRELGNERGVVTWRYRWNVRRTLKIRAFTVGDSGYQPSASRGLTIDQRRGGRVVRAPRAGDAAFAPPLVR